MNNGCGGGVSWFYKKFFRKTISAEHCCTLHDIAYQFGGAWKDRKIADIELRKCAANAGNFEGWRGPIRKIWRCIRAWIMYAAVRMFGTKYWNYIGD